MARFNAFISYSQRGDKPIATAIQDGLQRLGAKKYRLQFRALQIFRDETHAKGEDSLKKRIERGLDDSEYLVLIASPAITIPSVDSGINWIEEEVKYWISTKHPLEWKNDGRIDNLKLIICVVGGKIKWNFATNDFDWGCTDCLPQVFKKKFDGVPLWVSFQEIVEEQSKDPKKKVWTLDYPKFEQRIAEISARIQGKTVEELIARDRRAQRRWTTLLAATSIVLLMLIVLAVTMTINLKATNTQLTNTKNNLQHKTDTLNTTLGSLRSTVVNLEVSRGKERETNVKLLDTNVKLTVTNDSLITVKQNLVVRNAELVVETDRANTNAARADSNRLVAIANGDTARIEGTKVRLINNILRAENLALRSQRDTIAASKALLSVYAYDTLQLSSTDSLKYYFGSDSRRVEKLPVVYSALKDAYIKSAPRIQSTASLKALEPCGTKLVAAALDGTITMKDYAHLEKSTTIHYPGRDSPTALPLKIFSIPNTPCFLYSLSNGQVEVITLDIANNSVSATVRKSFEIGGLLKSVCTYKESAALLTENGNVFIMGLDSHEAKPLPQLVHVNQIQLISNDQLLLYDNSFFRIYSLDKHRQTDSLNVGRGVDAITVGNHDDIFYHQSGQVVQLNMKTGAARRVLEIDSPVRLLSLTHDGSSIVAATASKVLIINLNNPRQVVDYSYSGKIRQIRLNDEDMLFVGLDDGHIEFWPIAFNKLYEGVRKILPDSRTASLSKQ